MKIALVFGFFLLFSAADFSQTPTSTGSKQAVSPVAWEERQWPKFGLLELKRTDHGVWPGQGIYYPFVSSFSRDKSVPEWIRKIAAEISPQPQQIQVTPNRITVLVKPSQLGRATKIVHEIVVTLFANQEIAVRRLQCWEHKINDIFRTNCPP